MFDANAERRFLLLKKKLDSLHYCQPLTIESSALVERLLSDLIRTTEGFQSLKKTNEDLKQEATQKTQGLQPLQKENAKLLKENNELHYELIKVKETSDQQTNRWKVSLKTLEGEKNDLRFLVSQKQSNLQKIENENQALKQKLDVILTKVFSLKAGNKPLYNKDLETENLKNLMNLNTVSLKKVADSKEIETWSEKRLEDLKNWSHELKTADEKIHELETFLKGSNSEKLVLEEKIKHLELSLQNRDKEIVRLHSKLELSLPCDNLEKISFNYEQKQSKDREERFQHQLDFLTKENATLTEEVKTMKRDYARTELIKQELIESKRKEKELSEILQREKQIFYEKSKKLEQILQDLTNDKTSLEEILEEMRLKSQSLEEKIQILELELEKSKENELALEGKSKISHELASAYNSDKKAYVEKMEAFSQEKRNVENRLTKTLKEIEEKSSIIQDLQKNQTQQKAENTGLKRELELLKADFQEKNEEVKKGKTAVQGLENEIMQLQAQLSSMEGLYKETQISLDRLKATKSHAEEENSRLKADIMKVQANRTTSDSVKSKLESLYDSSLRDIEYLKGEIKFYEEKENAYMKEIFEGKAENNGLKQELMVLKEKNKSDNLEIEENRGLIKRLRVDLKGLEAKKQELDRDLVNLKFVLENQSNLEEKIKSLLLENEQKSYEISSLQKLLDQKELENIEKESSKSYKDRILNENKTEIVNLKEKNLALTKELSNLGNIQGRSYELGQENDQLKFLIESLKEKLALCSQDLEAMKAQNSNQELISEQLNTQIDRLNGEKDVLLRENTILIQQVKEMKTSELSSSSLGMRLQEKNKGLEIINEDLKASIRQLHQKNDELLQEIETIKADFRSLDLEKSHLLEENSHLKALITGLERTKEELYERLKTKSQEKSVENEQIANLQKEKGSLLQEIKSLDSHIKSLNHNILQIDQERDEMQNLVDKKTEALAVLQEKSKVFEVDNLELKRKINELMMDIESRTQGIQSLEASLKNFNRNKGAVEEENQGLKRTLTQKMDAINEMEEDLRLLSHEHKKMNEEMGFILQEKDDLVKELHELKQASVQEKHYIRALEMEKDDLIVLYRQTAEENEILKKNIEEVVKDNREMFAKLKEIEAENMFFPEERRNFEKTKTNLQNDLQMLQRQLSQLSRKNEKTEEKARGLEEEKKAMQRDLVAFEQSFQGETHQKIEFQRVISHLENEKQLLNEEIDLLNREIQSKMRLVEDCKKEMRSLEDVIEFERKGKFDLEGDLQALREENAKLRMNMFGKDFSRSSYKGLGEVALGTEGLKEKARTLQKDYEEILRKEG